MHTCRSWLNGSKDDRQWAGKYIINQKNSLIGNLVDIFRYFLPSFLMLLSHISIWCGKFFEPNKVCHDDDARAISHTRETSQRTGSTLGSRQRWCGGRGNEALKDTLRDLQGATLRRGERERSRIFLDKYPVFSCSSIFSLFHIEKEKRGKWWITTLFHIFDVLGLKVSFPLLSENSISLSCERKKEKNRMFFSLCQFTLAFDVKLAWELFLGGPFGSLHFLRRLEASRTSHNSRKLLSLSNKLTFDAAAGLRPACEKTKLCLLMKSWGFLPTTSFVCSALSTEAFLEYTI